MKSPQKRALLLIPMMAWLLLSACHSNFNDSASVVSDLHPSMAGIIGGEPAGPDEFPFIVNIWLNSPQDHFVGHLCGGSLIHKKWVLTAAHCVLQDPVDHSLGFVPLKEMTLFLTSSHRSGQGGRALKPRSILIHPQFSWPKYDVALIELAEAVEEVPPIALNQNAIVDFSSPQTAIAMGWGLIDELGKIEADRLQKVSLNLVSRELCRMDPYVIKKNWAIGADTLCAQTQLGKKATCGGDSGGPLVQNLNGQLVQIGIVSWGSACNLSFLGNQADVEGYSDVSAAYPWIQSQITK